MSSTKYSVSLAEPEPTRQDSQHLMSLNSLIDLIRDEQWERLERQVTEVPEDARQLCKVNISGQKTLAYALHYLCKKKDAPVKLVATFVGACDEALRTPDSAFQFLPIHLACQHDVSLEVFQFLVEAFPASLLKPDKEGNLPIHYACSLSSSHAIQFLLQSSPTSAKKMNAKNQTPLHLACTRYHVSLEVVEALILANPAACKLQDWQGRLPVHSACMWNADPCIIEALLREYPDAARLWDMQGLTPYGICRKRFSLSSSTPTIRVIRSSRMRNGDTLLRGRDFIQFSAENLSDAFGRHSSKPIPAGQ